VAMISQGDEMGRTYENECVLDFLSSENHKIEGWRVDYKAFASH
jgi:hypothetical protein